MEYHLRLQINPLIITIVGFAKVSAKFAIAEFNPIENVDHARWAAGMVGLTDLPEDAEAICQAIVDFNNETGYMFKRRSYRQVVEERKRVDKILGSNPDAVSMGALG